MLYMGDKRATNSKTTDLAYAKFILHKGLVHKELRDEIYCQVCKQVTNNPNRDSKAKVIIENVCTTKF